MAYQTAAQIRARISVLADDVEFPDATIEDRIAEFEEIAEDYRGVAFEPRTVTETHRLTRYTPELVLNNVEARSITSITADGTTVDSSTYDLNKRAGTVVFGGGYSANVELVVVYVHGLDEPPATVLNACREYVRAVCLREKSGIGRDVILQTTDGTITRYSTPDKMAGRPTGYIEVDRLLNNVPDRRRMFA